MNYTFLRKRIGLILGILVFTLVIFLPKVNITKEANFVAASTLLMAIWWITEAIPIPATALLPLVLYPMLRILPAKEVAIAYADSNVILFMGGFFIALAMQRHNLHKRIALKIILFLGSSPSRIILGFMVASAMLSMWISNTATAMMMFPIGLAVIKQFENLNEQKQEKNVLNFGLALMLGIAYASSIGGVGTLIGTPSNIVFSGLSKNLFPEIPEIGFVRWMVIGVPLVACFIPVTWFYLVKITTPVKDKSFIGGKNVIREELDTLGKMKVGEKITLIVFCIVAFGWIFKSDLNFGRFTLRGWAGLLGIQNYLHDSTIAIIGAILLFIIPVNLKKHEFVLNWEWAEKIPWGILLLFGGGFAIAKSFQSSGLDEYIGQRFGQINFGSIILLVISVCLLLTFLTEITSNTATITMMLPVLAAMSVSIGIHPFILMIPATISTSFAFMMPVATPPNAIVFGSGYIKIPQMARIGFFLNLIGVIGITIFIYFFALKILNIAN